MAVTEGEIERNCLPGRRRTARIVDVTRDTKDCRWTIGCPENSAWQVMTNEDGKKRKSL